MSTIKLADVDDYINPSQACINPIFTSTKKSNKTNNDDDQNVKSMRRKRTRRKRVPLVLSTPPPTSTNHHHESIQERNQQQQEQKQKNVEIDIDNGTGNDATFESLDKNVGRKNVNNTPPILSYSKDDQHEQNDNQDDHQKQQQIPSIPIDSKTKNEIGGEGSSSITIADCLACSGCITSAEAVLVTTQHSINTLKKNCNSTQRRKIVFTISPAVIADLIRVLYLEPSSSMIHDDDMNNNKNIVTSTYQKLTSYLHDNFHASIVLDGTVPQQISLIQSAIEFCIRYKAVHRQSDNDDEKGEGGDRSTQKKHLDERISNVDTPSIALSATQTRYLVKNNIDQKTEGVEVQHEAGIDHRLTYLHDMSNRCFHPVSSLTSSLLSTSIQTKRHHILPMLASSCPGFVCYVEKTNPEIIPNLCTVKSPMVIAGSIFKHELLQSYNEVTNHDPSSIETVGCINTIKSEDLDQQEINDGANADASTFNEPGEEIKQEVYHVAIMPCHDKKLEAERRDFAWEQYMEQQEKIVHDVDLVITTDELFTLLMDSAREEKTEISTLINDSTKYDGSLGTLCHYFESLPVAPIRFDMNDTKHYKGVYVCSLQNNDKANYEEDGLSHTINGSGSYADFIFRFASFALFGYDIPQNKSLPWKQITRRGSNGLSRRRRDVSGTTQRKSLDMISDHCEVALYVRRDGTFFCDSPSDIHHKEKMLLKFATLYGFKNIQILVNQMKNNAGEEKYHYVETMACPSGCLNGGGQIKLETKALEASESDLLGSIRRKEKPSEKRERVQRNNTFVRDMYPKNIKKEVVGDSKVCNQSLLHTRYHVVPKLELSTGSTAGVKVEDTNW